MTHRAEPTRRDFIAASTLGLFAMASLGQEKTPGSDSALLYVGTYTEGERTDGIYLLRMDTRTGELRRLGAVNAGANPSWTANASHSPRPRTLSTP